VARFSLAIGKKAGDGMRKILDLKADTLREALLEATLFDLPKVVRSLTVEEVFHLGTRNDESPYLFLLEDGDPLKDQASCELGLAVEGNWSVKS